MNRVVCFGEALIDFLRIGGDSVDGLPLADFRQFPGGAPANVAVAVAKLGGDAWFAGQVGNDAFGRFLKDSLAHYGVRTDFLMTHPDAPTALAFVDLDEHGDRSFMFCRRATADLVMDASQIDGQWFGAGDTFHFCSNTLTERGIAHVTETATGMARSAGSLVSFDVNLRHNLWSGGRADRTAIAPLLDRCDILKVSSDELDFLAKGRGEPFIYECLDKGVRLVLVTDGPGPVRYYGDVFSGAVVTTPCKVVDTTAAGDAFTGGLLFGLAELGATDVVFAERDAIEQLVRFATGCGTHAVRSAGAFPSLPTIADVEQYRPRDTK